MMRKAPLFLIAGSVQKIRVRGYVDVVVRGVEVGRRNQRWMKRRNEGPCSDAFYDSAIRRPLPFFFGCFPLSTFSLLIWIVLLVFVVFLCLRASSSLRTFAHVHFAFITSGFPLLFFYACVCLIFLTD